MIMIHRGMALLLVLGALLVITTAVSASMMSAANHQLGESIHRAEHRASDLLHASEAIIDRWLRAESARAVVDPSLAEPRVAIADVNIDDSVASNARVRLTAWDLLGMPRAGLPASHPLSRFAVADASISEASSLAEISDPTNPVHPEPDQIDGRIGGAVAVYPRDNRERGSQSVIINVNTAPEPLLRAAMRSGQRGDAQSVLNSRASGTPAPAPAVSRDASSLVSLTARSNLWAVRADISVGPVTRSWWTVYESRGRGWSMIDRHEIAD